jgi:hypothetical protein
LTRALQFFIYGLRPEFTEVFVGRKAFEDLVSSGEVLGSVEVGQVRFERFTVEYGRKPTDNEVAVLVRESRADRLAKIATEKVREQQEADLLRTNGTRCYISAGTPRSRLPAFFTSRPARQKHFSMQKSISLNATPLYAITN